MIPRRIRLAGFLSYKESQEIRFEGSSLWMLFGGNGSGKSSIFDAVTYSLFGHHRGGSVQASELINKETTGLEVEFDFTVDADLFRIKRTLKRLASGNKSTFQIFRSASGLDSGEWVPVPDTSSKKGFEEWIKDHIGLNFETFTSSVLLLQGKAEKLLDSTPSGRAGVLASIVDLERYQRLHAKADERRKACRSAQETLQLQLDAIRVVSDDEYALAGVRIEEAEAARTDAQNRIDALHALENQARRWTELQARLTTLRDRLKADEGLLGSSALIEKQYNRFRELRDVLPTIGTIITERGRVLDSERRTENLVREQNDLAERRKKLDHDLATARSTLKDLKNALAADEIKASNVNTTLRRLAGVIEQVRVVEDQQSELRQLEAELARLPAGAGERVRELQEKHEQLTALAHALPSLIRITDEKAELAQAMKREKQARADEARLTEEGKQAKVEFEALEASLTVVRGKRSAADGAVAEARALQQQAAALAEEFKKLDGEKSCRACGQPLTPKHFKDEKKARETALKEADARLKEATSAAAACKTDEADATAKEAAARKKLDELRDRYRDRVAEVKQASTDIRRLSESIRDAYLATPEPFRTRVSPEVPEDWTTVTFPARDELAALRRDAGQLDVVRKQLTEAQKAATHWQSLHTRTEAARERLTKLRQGLPEGDAVALRSEYAAAQAEETSLVNSVKGSKKAIATAEPEIDRLQRKLGEYDRELVGLEGEIRNEANSRSQSHGTITHLCRALPEAWQRTIETAGLSEQLRWKEEFEDLVRKEIEKKHGQLQTARGGMDRLRDEIRGLEEEVTSVPESARRSPDDVRREIAAAGPALEECVKKLLEAKEIRAVLDGERRRRELLSEQITLGEGEHNRYKLLSELLGRDRLQRHLVRQAERQIVQYANAMLDRLSDGQLFLKLIDADTGTDKALELECYNRATGGSPINVAFISGSQRFRVAVSLALGIGQYASTQHRPIECVIIDEGFGCLDRIGRQVMVQELQNLRGHLRCILLVSHQEEFADAFPNGYHFAMENGTTKVSRRMRS